MTTKVFGTSDDLIEFEGDVYGESCYVGDGPSEGALVVFDDGTQVTVKYGKPGGLGIWSITPLVKGALFDRIEVCNSEDAAVYSDVLHFKDGLKYAYVATSWERVK